MTHRYYSETPPIDGQLCLDGPEAHHLLHVMRGRVGDQVTVFDGHGVEYQVEVTRIDRRTVDVRIVEASRQTRELPGELIVGVALPKPDRQRFLLEKLVELGVHRLVPLRTDRSQGPRTNKGLDRLDRTIIEASKQCGRNQLMAVDELTDSTDFLSQFGSADVRWIAHPERGLPPQSTLAAASKPAQIVLACGPEGGWTDDEIEAARSADWQVITLGRRILRVETAATLLAGYWALWLEQVDSSDPARRP